MQHDQKHDLRPTESTEDIFLAREGLICRAWPKLHPCKSNMAFRPRLCVSVSIEMISDVIRLTLNTWKADQCFGFHCPADRQTDRQTDMLLYFDGVQSVFKLHQVNYQSKPMPWVSTAGLPETPCINYKP